MRSCMLKMACLDDAIRSYGWKAEPDVAQADEKLYQLALAYKHYDTVQQVAQGDVATVAMTAEHKKFNRTVKLQVGSKMFDPVFEGALIGKTAGQTYALEHAVGQIRYCVTDIQRLVVPAVSDEMAANAVVEGICTAAALREHYITEELQHKLRNEAYGFVEDFLKQCQFVIDEADLLEMDEAEMERCREISRSMDMVFDEMTEQQLLGAVGCHNISEFRAMIHGYHAKMLSAALVELALADTDAARIATADARKYYAGLLDRIAHIAIHNKMEGLIC